MSKANQKARNKNISEGERGKELSKYYHKPHNHFPQGKTGYAPKGTGRII